MYYPDPSTGISLDPMGRGIQITAPDVELAISQKAAVEIKSKWSGRKTWGVIGLLFFIVFTALVLLGIYFVRDLHKQRGLD